MKKVKIYTFSDKAPYFITWQAKLFNDFLKDDYEFIVMNNSSNSQLDIDIKNHCNANAIKCIDVENKDFSTAVYACSSPIQECIDKYISNDKDNISVILDSDLFLMREFSFNELIKDYDIAGIMQAREADKGVIIQYLWNCFLVINNTAPNIEKLCMWPGTINHAPTDVGGMSYFYLLYNDVKLKKIPCTGIIHDHPEVLGLIPEHVRNDYRIEFQSEIIEGSFFHYRGGSNWNNKSKEHHTQKQNFIKKLLKI
jgi:hypothetical protein